MLSFIKSFFCIYWDDHMIFILQFVNVVYHTLINLLISNHPCILGINPTWSWCMILLMYCWILFANISLRIFVSMFMNNVGLQFSFLIMFLSGFGIKVMLASKNELRSISCASILWKRWWRIDLISFLKFGRIYPFVPNDFCFGRYWLLVHFIL